MIQACSRQYIRVKWSVNIQLETTAGVLLNAQTSNISLGGLEIVCDRCTADTIMPNGYRFDPEQPNILSVMLSVDETDTVLQATCHVKNMRRLAENAYALHLAFYKLKPNNQQLLKHFVENNEHV